ncbi:hypothetical protein BDA96_04G099000 [Sorghum bicolor]|uniref:Uncharacterized protein n=2 Tax=Sorghum bicolor TaxID=4558 RepID=A0A921R4K7_SORBI|nr:hypothetical protein BDA96_04G099000 [Sorghum bicolor]OQU84634.1 hypothetical protein SORBI_3004G091401 [Sorghum bicolor]
MVSQCISHRRRPLLLLPGQEARGGYFSYPTSRIEPRRRSKKEGVWASFWASGQGYGTSRWLIIVNQFILCIKNAIS